MNDIKNTGNTMIVGLLMLLGASTVSAALVPFTLTGTIESADTDNIFNVAVSDIITATGSFDDSLSGGGSSGSITGLLITVGDLTFNDSMEAYGGASIELNPDNTLKSLLYEANEGLLGSLAYFDTYFLSFTGSAFNGPKSKGSPTELKISGHWDESAVLITTVPIPAAVWLFGSGLLGLIGIARKKAA